MAAQVLCDAGAGHPPDLRRHFLDDDHQRKGQHEGPGQGIAELCADLAMRTDAARIVVGRAGDKPRPQPAEEARLPGLAVAAGRVSIPHQRTLARFARMDKSGDRPLRGALVCSV